MAGAWAQPLGAARESAVKAAYLYKFGSFVEWPPGTFRGPEDPLVIGVWGDDAVASELDQLARGRSIEGHPVKVLRLREAEDANPLHILFAGGPREGRIRDVLAAVRGPVLTVADVPVGGNPGPVLHFTRDDGRVRFNASVSAAAARNLKLSAKLLAVALQVESR
nr:YfiR family protein [Ramlibacter paludis]